MVKFVTAVFGESYKIPGLALERTFKMHNTEKLHVFTDMPDVFEHSFSSDMWDIISTYPTYYHKGPKRNVFKFQIVRQMQDMYPGESIAWLDADTLVFDEMIKHIKSNMINVIIHGKREKERIKLGNHLTVTGKDYLISGFFSIPPGDVIDVLDELVMERVSWKDDRNDLGDQLLINHLCQRRSKDVHRLTDDKRFYYNLAVCNDKHPVINDRGLCNITLKDGKLFRGKPIVMFYWIKKQLDLHLADGFTTFSPPVREFLRSLYNQE